LPSLIFKKGPGREKAKQGIKKTAEKRKGGQCNDAITNF